MTRETKVGLLVALSFILLLGVVISETGEKRPPLVVNDLVVPVTDTPQSPLDSQGRGGELAQAGPRDRAHERAANVQLTGPNMPGTTQLAANVSRGDRTSAAPLNLDEPIAVQEDELPLDDVVVVRPRRRESEADTISPLEHNTNTDARLTEANRAGNTADDASAPADTNSNLQPADAPTGSRYVVRERDTLSSIAASQWGEAHRHRWQPILEANRDKLSAPRDLRIGMELKIPPAPVVNARAAPGTTRSGAPTDTGRTPGNAAANAETTNTTANAGTPDRALSGVGTSPSTDTGAGVSNSAATKPTPATGRMYTVRHRDTLELIAERELGDRRRWKEIFELNRQHLRDAHSLREGHRLLLPTASATQGGAGAAAVDEAPSPT